MKTLLCILTLCICGLAECQPVDPCSVTGSCYQLPAEITALTFTGPADTNYYKLGQFEPLITEPASTWLPVARISRPYCMFVHAGGGTPPYIFSATGLPPGITLETSGWLHGTVGQPNYVYNYTVAFTVTDATGTAQHMTKTLEMCWEKSNCTGFGK